ncbi:MAG: DNA topoisomerase VI subunit B, partial [archaeon]
ILPNIDVKIDELGDEYYEVTVTDNGPGITIENVGKAFGKLLAGTKFHRLMQSRGQQGIGASGCTMLSQMTTGKASKIITGKEGKKAIALELVIDPRMNEPKISNVKEIEKDFRGTSVQAKFKGCLYRDSDQGALEYLKRTAIANPHAQISFRDPMGQKTVFKRTHNTLPQRPAEIKPHPKGTTVDDVLTYCKSTKGRTVASFLTNDFDRMGAKGIEEIKKRVHFDLNKDPKLLTWEEAEEIVKAFKAISFIAPSTDALRPIGEEQIRKSLQSIVQPEFLTVLTRKPTVYAGGYPFQVEIAIAYGGGSGRKVGDQTSMDIMRFANRVPLLFDNGNCALTKAIQTIDWKRYDIKDPSTAPVTVFVNFISVHIPYTGAGKQAIADEEEVLEEIRLALMQTGRKAGIYIAHKRRESENQQKRLMFYKYIPEVCKALSTITKANEENLKKKMEKMVLEKLKIDEQKEEEDRKKTEKTLANDDNSFITKPKPEKEENKKKLKK